MDVVGFEEETVQELAGAINAFMSQYDYTVSHTDYAVYHHAHEGMKYTALVTFKEGK